MITRQEKAFRVKVACVNFHGSPKKQKPRRVAGLVISFIWM
nr:MAG TPA: hypothetical protein [Caudoviricetes sp.]